MGGEEKAFYIGAGVAALVVLAFVMQMDYKEITWKEFVTE